MTLTNSEIQRRANISKSMKGHAISSETKKKMSERKIGKSFSDKHREHLKESHTGLKQSQETVNKRRNKTKGMKRSAQMRINQSLRQTGEKVFTEFKTVGQRVIRNSTEYREWRLQVFGRDNFTCQKCNARGVYIEAHHIKSFAKFPELRFDISNGITLCKKCHAEIDSQRKLKKED